MPPLVPVSAETSDDWWYTIDDGTAKVTGYRGSDANVTIPATFEGIPVTAIGNFAFRHCTSLTNVTIPNSVTSIGSCAFFGCKSLTSITISDNVTSIGGTVFYYCTALTSVTIGANVTSIGAEVFFGCKALTNITIPCSVTSIDYDAFCECTALKTVYYGGLEEEWNNISINYGNDPLLNANIIFTSTDPEPGDLNNDGRVNAKDIIAVMKFILGNAPAGFKEAAADMNGDGRINAKDIILIMKKMISK